MPFYLEMSKNITKQRDIYDTVIFRFLQIFYCIINVSLFSYIYITNVRISNVRIAWD